MASDVCPQTQDLRYALYCRVYCSRRYRGYVIIETNKQRLIALNRLTNRETELLEILNQQSTGARNAPCWFDENELIDPWPLDRSSDIARILATTDSQNHVVH